MNMYLEWCLSLTPFWVSVTAFLTGLIFSVSVFCAAATYVFVKTKGHVLWLVLIVFVYAWYVALFGQG